MHHFSYSELELAKMTKTHDQDKFTDLMNFSISLITYIKFNYFPLIIFHSITRYDIDRQYAFF